MNDDNYEDENYSDENYDSESFNDDFDVGMDEEQTRVNNVKTWIIVGIVCFIVFIVVFALTNKLINGNKKQNTNNETNETPVEEVKYEKYKSGDSITLNDESRWHVLYDTNDEEEFVVLLSDEDVNTEKVLYGNINSFLKGTYKTRLKKSLECEDDDIFEVRLFAYIDLAEISGEKSSVFEPDTELDEYDIPAFIYRADTVTDTLYELDTKSSPVKICAPYGNKVATICLGDAEKPLPVRPVITIAKKLIKKSVPAETYNNDKEEADSNDNEEEDE